MFHDTKSAQVCGCDEGAMWVCQQHAIKKAINNVLDVGYSGTQRDITKVINEPGGGLQTAPIDNQDAKSVNAVTESNRDGNGLESYKTSKRSEAAPTADLPSQSHLISTIPNQKDFLSPLPLVPELHGPDSFKKSLNASSSVRTVIELDTDAKARKEHPVGTGVLDYFPLALYEISKVSYVGNKQHNGDAPLFWDRTKSTDEADTMIRHFLQRGTRDTDGLRHSAKMAWRALALLQKEIEADQS